MRRLLPLVMVAAGLGCDPDLNAASGRARNDGGGADEQSGGAIDVAEKPLLRLTTRQYANVLRDVLGVADPPLENLPPELSDASYYNHASAQVPDDALIAAYARVAGNVAQKLVADPQKRAALAGCTPAASAADPCVKSTVQRLGTRLFRRPLEAENVDRWASLATGASDGWQALRSILEAMLQSPRLLYRFEPTVAEAERPGFGRYDGHAMAARLSFTILDSVPDDDLYAAAVEDRLASRDDVRKQAERLLRDPRAKAGAREFYRQWLDVDPILTRSKDATAYPAFSSALAASMHEETMRVLEEHAASEGPFLDALVADHTYVDGRLATLYGITKPGPPESFERVRVPDARLGVLGHASFLANDSKSIGTSPTHRGLFVMTRLLCMQSENPVMVMPVEDPSPETPKTTRQLMETVHAAGTCQGCHRKMDGIGYGFEGFDGIGERRVKENGLIVDDRGVLLAGGTERTYRGEVELARLVRSLPEVERCLVRHNVRWSLGRDLSAPEELGVTELAKTFSETTRSYAALILSLVQSDFFRLRPQP